MASLDKVRVQVLGEKGEVLKEVDVLTSADSVTFSDGETFQQKLDKGELKGAKGDTGAKGDKGDKGDAFAITKTYKSIDEMNKDFGNVNVKEGAFVLIDTGSVEDEDNAKLYVKGKDAYSFITDLSGAKGIKGETGAKGDKGDTGAKGDKGDTGAKGEKGDKGDQGIQGVKGDKGDNGDEIKIGETVETATTAKIFFKVVK